MIYPKNIIDKLGFSEIIDKVKSYCLSDMGRIYWEKWELIRDFQILDITLRETLEFKNLIEFDDLFPSSGFHNFQAQLVKIRTEGSYLEEEELDQLLSSFKTIFLILIYFKNRKEKYPLLIKHLEGLDSSQIYFQEIEKILDTTGKLKLTASKDFEEIHRKINALEKDAHRTIQNVFALAQKENWTGDGNLTIRNGRLCIPVLSENKRRIKGYIQDESATGQTVYIEPAEVFEINNEIRDLEFHKRRERIRILINITNKLRPNILIFSTYYNLLGKLDFIRAKALFALELDAYMPKIINEPYFDYIEARHPLLYLNLKKEGRKIIPLNIKIDEVNRVVLVSGPNAGGKSVCLKTIGLLQIMLQAGLLIPARDSSEVGIFNNIFADIGDEQSIESDLSTYSAHLTHMRTFLELSDEHSLILMDEFGTGTDPQFGGPIAEAVLQELNRNKIKGVITTHYSNLKVLAGSEAGLMNASMLFDSSNLKPLYRLEMGKPGSSYAFEIAENIGLPKAVVELAKSKIGVEQKRVEELLSELEKEKILMGDRQIQIQKMQKKYNFLVDENEKLKEFYDDNKNKLLKEAKKEAESIILNANKLVEKTIRDIKTGQAEKISTLESRKKLKEELDKVQNKELSSIAIILKKEEPDPVHIGDWVKIEGQDTIAQIITIQKESAVVAIGDLRSVIKISRLEKASRKEEKKWRSSTNFSSLTENNLNFSPEMDIRGKRGDEAVVEVEKYLDRAIMLGINQLKIIHGKGDGILRKLIRNSLKSYKQVKSFEDEHPDRGGDGITYVNLKD